MNASDRVQYILTHDVEVVKYIGCDVGMHSCANIIIEENKI